MAQDIPAPDLAFDRSMTVIAGQPQVLAAGIRRILADNPSALTFTGTNTYLIGTKTIAVIDPGPDSEPHRRAILAAAGSAPITHILLTHTHRDHSAGIAKLAAATGAITCGYGPVTGRDAARRALAAGNIRTRGFFDASFTPLQKVGDGDIVHGADWHLTAVHTPGHAPDHLCFRLDTDSHPTGVLLSGDHVMGWNTSVIAPPEGHMGDYLASLERLLTVADTLYLAGHGEPVTEPHKLVRAFLVHRQMREAAILECVREGLTTVPAIRDRVYKGIAEPVQMAAALSVLAHIESLVERSLITSSHPLSLDAQFSPTP
jgi:glyoxylase-like metal-dependent hydrolase (beta-lactamase superfamily II)